MFVSIYVCMCVYVFVGLGFELRASHLQSRHSTHFAVVSFGDVGLKKYLLRLALNCDPLNSFSQVFSITGVNH
jgi:hypothetical protein